MLTGSMGFVLVLEQDISEMIMTAPMKKFLVCILFELSCKAILIFTGVLYRLLREV